MFIRLEYAFEVWDGRFERDIEKLEKLQLEAARNETGLTKFGSKVSLYFIILIISKVIIIYI
jgi:hypothetical protein